MAVLIRRFLARLLPAIFSCLLLLLIAPCLGAQETGAALSLRVFAALEDAGLAPEKHYLSEIQSDGYPYNVLVTFLPYTLPVSAGTGSPLKSGLTLLIAEEDGAAYLEDWIDFLAFLKSSSLPVPTQVVFTANDFSPLPPQYRRGMPAGTLRYLDSLDANQEISALLFCPGGSGPAMLPGSRSIAAPSWLTAQIPFPVFGGLLSLYRLGLTPYEERLALLGEREIPAAALVWNPADRNQNTALFSGLRRFVTAFKAGDKADIQYSRIPSGLGYIEVSGFAFMALYAGIAGLCLLYLCFGSLFEKKRRAPARRVWFILPVLLGLTTAGLYWGQSFSGAMGKLLLVFFAFSLLNGALNFAPHIDPRIYGTLFLLQTTVNVLLFGTIDAGILLLFALVFIAAALLVRAMGKNIIACLAAVVLAALYIPLLLAIGKYGDRAHLAEFLHGGLLANGALAFLVLPFLLIWFRIQAQFCIFLRQRQCKRRYIALMNLALAGIAGGLLYGASFALIKPLEFPRAPAVSPEPPLRTAGPSGGAFLDAEITAYFDHEILRISAGADLPILRCDVSLVPLDGSAVYSSTAPFTVIEENGAVGFHLPEYPPNPLELSVTGPRGQPARLMGVFFLLGEGGAVIREEAGVLVHRTERL